MCIFCSLFFDPDDPWELDELMLVKNVDKSGIQESLLTALEGEVGGVGLTRGGVCRTELFEFSRTESKKWSVLEVMGGCDAWGSKKARVELILSLLFPGSISRFLAGVEDVAL